MENTSNRIDVNNSIKKEDEFNLMDLVSVALSYWKWYLLSVIVCLACAYLYVKRSPNIYSRQATVLIKSSDKGSSQMESEAAAFEDLGIISMGKSVDNELLVFKTKRLMYEVVRRLHLDVDYSHKGYFRSYTLYSKTPVLLSFPDAKDNERFSLVMTPQKNRMVRLHSFVKNGEVIEGDVTAMAGATVMTPVGRVKVEKNKRDTRLDLVGVDINVRRNGMKELTWSFNARLETSLANKMSTIVVLGMRDVSKERAEDVLNTLIEVYNEDAISDKNKVVISTEEFINERLRKLEGELGKVDATISNFKANNQLTDIHADASAFRNSFSAMETKVAELQNQKSIAQYILDHIQSRSGDIKFGVIPNNVGINNAQVENMISEYNTMVLQRERLQQDAGSSNPQVLDLTSSIEQLRTRIMASVSNLIRSLSIEMTNVKNRVDESSNRLTAVPGQQKTVTSVERQQRIKENLYMYLLNKREANNLKRNMTESNARVLDPADGGEVPVAPRKAMIMLIGLLIGLTIPSGIIWFSVTNTNKVRGRKDLDKVLSMPFIGEVPLAEDAEKFSTVKEVISSLFNKKQERRKHLPIIVTKDSTDPVSEAIRIVRSNIHMLQAGDPSKKVLMFTSYIPNAGKTFVCSNLCAGLALTGKKVLVVDLDIRRRSLTSVFSSNSSKGVTTYLAGYDDNIDELIVKSKDIENLYILPAGPVPPNPAELLLLPTLDKMIDELRDKFDYIVIDSVPSMVIADAMISNRVADMTLFVVRAGNLDRRMLPDVEQLYQSGKFKNMCMLLNGVTRANIYSSYYGYGYHKYGY